MNERFFKQMFLVGALWNLAGGLFVLFAAGWIFGRDGLTPPQPPMFYQSWVALFMTFGIGYYWISRDLRAHRDLIVLGIVGKLAYSGVFFYNVTVFPGQVPGFFWIPTIGDLVFVGLYALALRYLGAATPMRQAAGSAHYGD